LYSSTIIIKEIECK